MKIIDFLKIKWREALRIEEEKEAFFHGCNELIASKHYDRLFRNFRQTGEVLYFSTEKGILYLKTNDSIIISTDVYYDIIIEIFCNKIYTLPPQVLTNDFVVFDLGMNRGYAGLFFANEKNCSHVYGFELMKDTYSLAMNNINLNPNLKDKITAFNYGLWENDEEIDIETDGTDGHTSIKEIPNYLTENKKIQQKATVKKASNVFLNLLKTIDNKTLKVLKIDVEGSEYTIFRDLFNNKVIQAFDIIIGEFHDGLDNLEKYLPDFYCSYLNYTRDKRLGSMVFINKKHTI
jgi:FkbM family methyltransferase